VGHRSAWLSLAACIFLAGGCTPPGDAEGGSGSLDVMDEEGGVSIAPPRGQETWWGTFGARTMCTDEPVTLTSAEARWKVEPMDWRFFVRRVDVKPGSMDAGSFLSWTGAAPDFAEPYSDGHLGGKFTAGVDGVHVDNSCDKDSKSVVELVLSVESDKRGSWLRDLTIDYRGDDGKTHTLVLDQWQSVTCGSQITDPNICQGGR